jgi:phenylpropionate dioxygenase-like ring-hydroxylating dioxygenase large terminal subunit
MPAGFYTDPAIFAAEREKLFLKHWFFLTRAEELPARRLSRLRQPRRADRADPGE